MTAIRFEAYPALCEQRVGGRALARLRDGQAAAGAGVFLLGATLAGAIEWFARSDDRVGVFPWLATAGVLFLAIGAGQRGVARRRRRAGITVAAQDPAGGSDGIDLAESAVQHSRQTCELTVAVEATLTGDGSADLEIAQQLREHTTCAIRLANRFKRDAVRVNLYPTMRLHLGFWLGAELGRSPSKPIGIIHPKGGAGDDSYFLATVLARPAARRRWRLRWPGRSPFEVSQQELTEADRPRVALVVRTQRRPAATDEQLAGSCQDLGIHHIVWFRLKSAELPSHTRAFTRAVNQIRRDWPRWLPADSEAEYVAVLDTTVTVAMALGGYLAGPNPGLWTAYTQDRSSGALLRFPPTRAVK